MKVNEDIYPPPFSSYDLENQIVQKETQFKNESKFMEKSLGKDIQDVNRRKIFISDNADEVVKKTYMKQYTVPELQGKKEDLTSIEIEISELEAEKKAMLAEIKGKLKPLYEQKAKLVGNIKAKAELVTEECYRITDQDAGETGFYNSLGDLIEMRQATADEMQGQLFRPSIHMVEKEEQKESRVIAS